MAVGLTTDESLKKLRNQLCSIILLKNLKCHPSMKDFIKINYVPMWGLYLLSSFFTLIVMICLIYRFPQRIFILWDILVIVTLITCSVSVTYFVKKRVQARISSIILCINYIIKQIDDIRDNDSSKTYASLFLPHSMSYNFQWTYRDNSLTNVPVSLLVEGDVIHLRHGQIIMSECTTLADSQNQATEHKIGDTYFPKKLRSFSGRRTSPMLHEIRSSTLAVVTATPIIAHVRRIINEFQKKENSLQHSSVYLCFKKAVFYNQLWSICFLFTVLGLAIIRAFLHNHKSISSIIINWIIASSTYVFISSICICLSVIWMALLGLSVMRLQECIRKFTIVKSEARKHASSKENLSYCQINSCHRFFSEIFSEFFVSPKTDLEQLLIVLGTVSSVCFVDKKGILSLPIPTPEKVFFFRNQPSRRRRVLNNMNSFDKKLNPCKDIRNVSSFSSSRCQQEQTNNLLASLNPVPSSTETSNGFIEQIGREQLIDSKTPVILNITTSSTNIYAPCMDSPRWQRFIDSLKPIGLSLLLNNCQPHTRRRYAEFADHLTAMTTLLRPQPMVQIGCGRQPNYQDPSGHTVAVVNNRCLCGLAYQMGFSHNVPETFSFASSVGVYRSIDKCEQPTIRPRSCMFNQPLKNDENVADMKSGTRALHIQEAYASAPKDAFREAIPVPNCFCVLTRGSHGDGGYQVMTQGSGDLVASLCIDVWDGRGLSTLTEADRGKLLDFYNRNVSTAYCQAFAYAPLLKSRLPIVNCRKHRNSHVMREQHKEESVKCVVLELPVNFELKNRLTFMTKRSIMASKPVSVLTNQPTGLCSPSRTSFTRRRCTRSFHDIPDGPRLAELNRSSLRLTRPPRLSCPDSPVYRTTEADFSTGSSPIRRRSSRRGTGNKLRQRRLGVFPRAAFSCGSLSYLQGCEESLNPAALQNALNQQVFLGMLSLQYQAVPGIVEIIRKLNQACIRFVHFSKENQLRSRVFAERLGLEADWNCHISLANNVHESVSSSSSSSRKSRRAASRSPAPSSSFNIPSFPDSNVSIKVRPSTFLPRPQGTGSRLWRNAALSAPNLCHLVDDQLDTQKVLGSSKSEIKTEAHAGDSELNPAYALSESSLGSSNASKTSSSNPCSSSSHISEVDVESKTPTCSSTDSLASTAPNTTRNDEDNENSDDNLNSAYNYVFSNKSRLPCGIQEIRSHLENVDNVPLKVSLFTDCNPAVVGEMITILQEYGETVCIVGSCLSMTNAELFFKGNTAIALFPVLPLVCGNENVGVHSTHRLSTRNRQFHSSISSNFSSSSSSSERESSFGVLFSKRRRRQVNRTKASSDSAYDSNLRKRDDLRGKDGPTPSSTKKCLLKESDNQVVPSNNNHNSLLNLAGQLIGLGAPLIGGTDLDLLQIISEAHASINNIRDCLTFAMAASCGCGLFYLHLIACLPAVPILPPDSSLFRQSDWLSLNQSTINQFAWLPPVLISSSFPLIIAGNNQYVGGADQSWAEVVELLRYSTVCIAFGGQLFWLVLLVIPLLSTSIFGRTVQRMEPLRQPPVNRIKSFSPNQVQHFVCVNIFRFLPSLVVCLLSSFSHIFLLCPTAIGLDFVCLPPPTFANSSRDKLTASKEFLTNYIHLMPWVMLSQEIAFFQLVVYLVIISFSYANWGQWGYNFRFSTNPQWLVTALTILVSHTLYLTVRLVTALPVSCLKNDWPSAHPAIFICGLLWCPLLLLINEAINWRERKAIHARNRSAKLFFDTKLGMYSPV